MCRDAKGDRHSIQMKGAGSQLNHVRKASHVALGDSCSDELCVAETDAFAVSNKALGTMDCDDGHSGRRHQRRAREREPG
jgi:hypothetical protein